MLCACCVPVVNRKVNVNCSVEDVLATVLDYVDYELLV